MIRSWARWMPVARITFVQIARQIFSGDALRFSTTGLTPILVDHLAEIAPVVSKNFLLARGYCLRILNLTANFRSRIEQP